MKHSPPPPRETRGPWPGRRTVPDHKAWRLAPIMIMLALGPLALRAQVTYTVDNYTSDPFQKVYVYYNVIGGGASTYVVTGIPIGTNTINLPSNCDYITGVRIYCYSWSVLSYVHNNSYYCGAQDPYTPPCYAGRYTNNYKCPPDGVSGTTGCDSGSYCIYYQHCNDDNWDGSTGHCMNNGALRIIDPGPNYCPGGGSPRCEFP